MTRHKGHGKVLNRGVTTQHYQKQDPGLGNCIYPLGENKKKRDFDDIKSLLQNLSFKYFP